jgi:hypothetical protein
VLLKALKREIDVPRDVLNAVTYDRRKRCVAVSFLRPPVAAMHAPVLVLDGTGDPQLNRALFGDSLVHEEVRIERNATVTGTIGKWYSRQSITGCDRHGHLMASREADADRLRVEVGRVVRGTGVPTLLVATERAKKALIASGRLPGDAKTAHFGALRGRNAFEAFEAAVVVGQESVCIHSDQFCKQTCLNRSATDPGPAPATSEPAPSAGLARHVHCSHADPDLISYDERDEPSAHAEPGGDLSYGGLAGGSDRPDQEDYESQIPRVCRGPKIHSETFICERRPEGEQGPAARLRPRLPR